MQLASAASSAAVPAVMSARIALPPERQIGLSNFAAAIRNLVHDGRRDLSARQLGVLTTLALQPELNTIRSLAVHLRVSKPAITRAVDRLEAEGLAKRRPDPKDRRSVCVGISPAGSSYLDDIEVGLLKPAMAEA